MKVEELIVRIVGGATVGVLIGMVFVIVPPEISPIVRRAVGLIFVFGMLSSLVGLKYSVRGAGILLVFVLATIFLKIPFLVQAGKWVLTMANIVGTTLIVSTTPSLNTAMTFWGVIGAFLSFYWGITGSWEETVREIKEA
jgi:hypothetical protein